MTIHIGLLTVSDRSFKGEREDTSGPALEEMALAQGWDIIHKDIVPDDLMVVGDTLSKWADSGDVDLILTTGGTGFSPRDVTPEATQAIIERPAPGLAEAMRSYSIKITPHAMLSRAVAGIRASTLIINLPGSPKAAVENLQVISSVLTHAVHLLREDPRAEAEHRNQ